jgi:soluble lytic murein transglycosylase-like protein
MTIQERIRITANQYGVPPEVALAVANRESGFNQGAMGAKGEIGVYQLMPSTAREVGVNASDLGDNITGGIAYLKQQFDKFGDWGKALAAYNAGASMVSKGKIPQSTKDYVSSIVGSLGNWSGGGNVVSNSYVPELTVGESSLQLGVAEGDMGIVVVAGLVAGLVGVWLVGG